MKPQTSALPVIAERLRHVRGKLSQAHAAQILEVHPNTIGKYERGERSPDVDFLVRFCINFDVRPDWLILGLEPMRIHGKEGEKSLFKSQIDAAERIILDLMEEEGIKLDKQQFDAVHRTLKEDIITKTRAAITVVRLSSEEHSNLIVAPPVTLKRMMYEMISELGWSEEERTAWLLSHYCRKDFFNSSYDDLKNIGGHLFDLLVEKKGEEYVFKAFNKYHFDIENKNS